jgi:hypothetical protein
MRGLVCAGIVIAVAVATSACASGHAAQNQSSTDAVQLHELGYNRLSPRLQNFIRSTLRDSPDGHVTEVDVYGPASRAALVKASSGDIVYPTGREATKPFYLIVFHGHFICRECTGPAGAKPPQGTIETNVWSPSVGSRDFGVQSSLPAAVSLLNRLAVIQVS